MAENQDEGPIRRANKSKPTDSADSPGENAASAAGHAPGDAHGHAHGDGNCPSCTRLRAALRTARQRLRRLVTENRTLREELLSAGEMIENLAQDLEKPY